MSQATTLSRTLFRTPTGRKAWHQERVIFETTEMLCALLEREGVSRSELASRMETTKGYITQLLDGSRNMQLRTVSDTFLALGYEFHPSSSRIIGDTEGDVSADDSPLPVQFKWSAEMDWEMDTADDHLWATNAIGGP